MSTTGKSLAAGGKRNRILTIVLLPLLTALVGTLLLTAASFLPTEWIRDHAYASAYQLNDEGAEGGFYSPAGRKEYQPDNFTDSLIIQTSYTLDRENPDNVLLNRIATEPVQYSQRAHLVDTVEGRVTASESYSRYWMGFRVFIRPLLLLTAYRGIRVITAALDWILLAAAVAATAKRGSVTTALALAAAVGLTEPYAVVSSLQFSCCFLLALVLIVWLNFADVGMGDRRCFTAFCLFGALTQYFDFYTYPLIVCALPLLVLIARSGEDGLWRRAGSLFAAWFFGWLLMWLYKLCFVTLFTPENGFADAWRSVAMRFGVEGYKLESVSYSPADALRRVWEYLGLPSARVVLPALAVLLAAAWAYPRLRSGKNGKQPVFLAAGCLPILWMAASAQPVYIHYWFQYRNVCVLYFALLLFLAEGLKRPGSRQGL